MSPDDATPIETQQAAPAAEPAQDAGDEEPKKDRMAFLGKSGDSLERVPGFKKIPRSMRLLVVLLIVVVVLLAVIAVAMSGDDEPTDQGPPVVKPEKLDDYSDTFDPIAHELTEGNNMPYILAELLPQNSTYLISSITAVLEWEDEPDSNIGPRVKYNEPDTFQLEINSSANASAMSPETANQRQSSQTITLTMDVGASGYDYIMIGNASDVRLPDNVVMGDIEVIVHMIEAGDYHNPPELVYINDFGNAYTLTITVEGKVLA